MYNKSMVVELHINVGDRTIVVDSTSIERPTHGAERLIIDTLEEWFESPSDKPLEFVISKKFGVAPPKLGVNVTDGAKVTESLGN